MAREVTPSLLNTTSGCDPASGGPLDAVLGGGQSQGISFTPLLPPRMPAKDAKQ